MTEDEDQLEHELYHVGILRKSGRYPWGSGATPHQRNQGFLDYVDDLKKKGMSDLEIAKGMDISTTELRAAKSIAKNAQKKEQISQATRLKDKGLSNIAIGEKMGIGESSVRALLDPVTKERNEVLMVTANMLKDQLKEKGGYLDVGVGTENHLGISDNKLSQAIAVLKEDGYKLHYLKVQQLGTGKETTVKVLTKDDVPFTDVLKNQDKIRTVSDYSEDGGRTFLGIEPPKSVSSDRVYVRYAEEGGSDKDGVIELRRGVDDISLGASRYAQVRIAVDDSHYLKGMAMYNDDIPDGYDMVFNTNKSKKANKLEAMKELKADDDNPFGSIVRQKHYVDKDGKKQLSPLNIVGSEDPDGIRRAGEEGAWYNWSKNLSSQFLSKQSPQLAKEQLGLSYDIRKAEYDEIMSLTNPAVKKKLLQSFADGADSAAVHLKAAGLPRTRSHVILPIPEMKDTEVYAPNYKNGEKVVLIRHPHGGTFEIPELTVNNRNPKAKSLLGNALDAVGISPKVAERLSGADFDGDTVLVIPNNNGKVTTSKPLAQLKDFDPKALYPAYEGMKPMTARTKGLKMGDVSNLITDMSIAGASTAELARAVKHSMVVIDAEKHKLNYKQSEKDNGIAELKTKYQKKANGGASTLISRASSDVSVDEKALRKAKDGGPIDAATGKLVYVPTGNSYIKPATTRITPKGKEVVVPEKVVYNKTKSKKMLETDDAYTLSSGTKMEAVYADHANKLKALANESRKAYLQTKTTPYSPSAKVVYTPQVDSLKAKLNVARKNKPLERNAQLLANATVKAKRQANPDMDAADLKKIKNQALMESRIRTGALKQRVVITPLEWEAIQAGAISNNMLEDILNNTDLDKVKELATPRLRTVMVPAKVAKATSMLANGYTQAEVAEALGVPVSTLHDAIQ